MECDLKNKSALVICRRQFDWNAKILFWFQGWLIPRAEFRMIILALKEVCIKVLLLLRAICLKVTLKLVVV